MKVSRYWARVSALAKNHNGDDFHLVAWSSSNVDDDDANARASTKLNKWIDRLSSGEKLKDQYPYESSDSIREELVEEIIDANNQLIAAITRNNYGALVLNAANVMFIDVDLPTIPAPSTSIIRFFSGLFGKKQDEIKTEESVREEYLQKFSNFQKQHPGMAFRIYATTKGFRLLMLHDTFDPLDPAAQNILEQLESDALYRNLCKNQQCYRARLTPKPWRCDLKRPPNRYPRASEGEQKRFHGWLESYENKIKQYSVCKLIAESGRTDISTEVNLIMDLHDRYVLDAEEKVLA